MARNLVICLDGTAGQVRGTRGKHRDSNSLLLYELLDLSDETRQTAYYDPGVGTFASPGAWSAFARWVSRMGGNIWGAGIRQNLGEAYIWLMKQWQPGDRIFVFGFSRGAFTARALAGMLRAVGLLRPEAENLVPYVVSVYARRGGTSSPDWDAIHRHAELFAHRIGDRTTIPIDYLGLWDTVKALGVARVAPTWPYTRQLPNARRIRHAVSIDEWRRPFAEYLVPPEDGRECDEQWFAGIHSDVGGTFKDDSALSTIALKWITEGAISGPEGERMLVRPDALAKLRAKVTRESAAARAHRDGWYWGILIPRRRPIPPGAVIHSSVQARSDAMKYLPRLPADHTWGDPKWAGEG